MAGPLSFVFNRSLVDRATFIADCDATLAEVCSKMDTECPPFVCTRQVEQPKTFFGVTSVAFANLGVFMGVLFPALSFLASKIYKPIAKVQVTETKGVELAHPDPEAAQEPVNEV